MNAEQVRGKADRMSATVNVASLKGANTTYPECDFNIFECKAGEVTKLGLTVFHCLVLISDT